MKVSSPAQVSDVKKSMLSSMGDRISKSLSSMYNSINILKKQASNPQQLDKIKQMEIQIDNLAVKALNQSTTTKSSTEQANMENQINYLKEQLMIMQKKHEQLEIRQSQIQQRVSDLECQCVSRAEFEQLKMQCQQRFSMFENRFRVVQDSEQKCYLYVDEEFKNKIKPSEKFRQTLEQLMKTDYRLFEYARKLYWSLINQILAFRALSTGMIQKGSLKDKNRESSFLKQVGSMVSSATYLITGIPFLGGVILIVRDISAALMNKQEELLVKNMAFRLQSYFTEEQISEDVATAVLQMINNSSVRERVGQMKARNFVLKALTKFIQTIQDLQISPEMAAQIFASKFGKIKKQSQDTEYITENVLTDSSLIIWKMASRKPLPSRFAVSEAAKFLFNKSEGQNQSFTQQQFPQQQFPQQNYINQSYATQFNKYSTMNQQNECNQNFSFPNQSSLKPRYFKITIMKANLQIKKQLIGKMNPYCVIKYGSRLQKTQIHKQGDLMPYWNSSFIFESAPLPSTISLQVYDKEKVFSDDFLGSLAISDSQIDGIEREVQLWNQNKLVGSVFITLSP